MLFPTVFCGYVSVAHVDSLSSVSLRIEINSNCVSGVAFIRVQDDTAASKKDEDVG